MDFLPAPDVVRCFFAKQFQPHLPAMELEWNADAPGVADRTWYFPNDIAIRGGAPRRFGVVIQRSAQDQYNVRLLWNDVCMVWANLRRTQIMTSGLSPVLQALGTDVWHVLEQPVDPEGHAAWRVADLKMTG